jgi:hypothetical protein
MDKFQDNGYFFMKFAGQPGQALARQTVVWPDQSFPEAWNIQFILFRLVRKIKLYEFF